LAVRDHLSCVTTRRRRRVVRTTRRSIHDSTVAPGRGTDPFAIATRDIVAGESRRLDDRDHRRGCRAARPQGRRAPYRGAGEKIQKYRVAIGTATADIAPGEIVHTHNLRSDCFLTYTLQAGHRFGEDA
jgi:SAF domain